MCVCVMEERGGGGGGGGSGGGGGCCYLICVEDDFSTCRCNKGRASQTREGPTPN